MGGQTSISGGALVTSRQWRSYDEVQGDETKMMARQGPREFPAATLARDWRFGLRR
jgi:hypothetical protein